MYRLLIAILLSLEAASPAPQGKDSDVTYVKIQPVVEDTPLQAAASTRESRIEKLPLTIPGNVSITDKEPDKLNDPIEEISTETAEKRVDVPEVNTDLSELKVKDNLDISENVSENLEGSETNQSEQITDPSTEESNTTDDLSEISPTDDLSVSHSESQSDTLPSENGQSDRRARNFESIDTTETSEDVTEKYEDELIDHTIIEAPRTKAPPKFIPKTPKLSYYPKPRVFQSYSSNHLDIGGKRKFRSRCSCQKIWNCPKLQISVPRCPDEYFLCCF